MEHTSNTTRVALIFGGDGYVGSAVAQAFEQSGWISVRAGRHTHNDDTHVASDIEDSVSVMLAFNTVMQKYGRVDACIHTASPTLERVPFIASSTDSFRAHVHTAVLGTTHIVNAALASSTVKNIVVITSKATDATATKMGAYPFAKKMQRELCKTFADRLPDRIHIHAIAPGFLPGGLNDDLPQSVRETYALQKDGSTANAHTIARIIVDICEHKPQYASSGDIDGETNIVTPF